MVDDKFCDWKIRVVYALFDPIEVRTRSIQEGRILNQPILRKGVYCHLPSHHMERLGLPLMFFRWVNFVPVLADNHFVEIICGPAVKRQSDVLTSLLRHILKFGQEELINFSHIEFGEIAYGFGGGVPPTRRAVQQ